MPNLENRNVILTGGAGFIGSNLCEKLSRHNEVTVIDNLHTGSIGNISGLMNDGKVKFIEDDAKNISRSTADADLIFHLGIYSSSPMYVENPRLVGEVIDGAISVFEYSRKKDVTVVFASTSSIYNGMEPPHREDLPYKVTDFYTEARIAVERLGELYSKLYGVNISAMRFFSVYGKNEGAKGKYANLVTQFILSMKSGQRPLIYGDGNQRRDFISVDDVTDALILAAGKSTGFEVYNVGTGKNYSLNEIVDKINTKLGVSIKPRYVPLTVKNYVRETLADTDKAFRKIGFKSKIGLEEGIDREIKEYAR